MNITINDLVYLSSKILREYVRNKEVDMIEYLSFHYEENRIYIIDDFEDEKQFCLEFNKDKDNKIKVFKINEPRSKREHTLFIRKIINFCDLLIRESEGKLKEEDFIIPSLNLSLKHTRFAFA